MKLSPREASLKEFIRASEDVPVVWGVSDCSSWPATWVERITGRRVTLPVYASAAEADALIAAGGGLDRLWHDALAPIGIHPTAAPALGDVAIFNSRLGPSGLIMAHGGIGFRRISAGVHAISPRGLIAAWRVA